MAMHYVNLHLHGWRGDQSCKKLPLQWTQQSASKQINFAVFVVQVVLTKWFYVAKPQIQQSTWPLDHWQNFQLQNSTVKLNTTSTQPGTGLQD